MRDPWPYGDAAVTPAEQEAMEAAFDDRPSTEIRTRPLTFGWFELGWLARRKHEEAGIDKLVELLHEWLMGLPSEDLVQRTRTALSSDEPRRD